MRLLFPYKTKETLANIYIYIYICVTCILRIFASSDSPHKCIKIRGLMISAKRTEWRIATHQRKLEWNIRKEKRTNLPIRSIGRFVSFKHDHRPATYCLFGSIIEQLQAYINYRPFHRTMFLSGAWFAISRVLLKTATD